MTVVWIFLALAVGSAIAGIPLALDVRRCEHPKYRNVADDEQRGAL